jgi:hypothetical protein
MWRCATLYYDGVSRASQLMLHCLLGFLGLLSLAAGIILLAAPHIQHPAVPMGFLSTPILFLSISAISNVTLSLLITLRILRHQVNTRLALGASHGSLYTRIMVMCLESCSLIVIPTLVYIAMHSTKANGSQIPLLLLPHFCVISPLLIVSRVVEGRDASTTLNLTEIVSSAASAHQKYRKEVIQAAIPTLSADNSDRTFEKATPMI